MRAVASERASSSRGSRKVGSSILSPLAVVAGCVFGALLWSVWPGTASASVPTMPGEGKTAFSDLRFATEHLDAGRYREAIAAFDAAIAKDPTPEAYYWRGECLRKTWWLNRAAADFDQAVKLDPRHARAYLSRGLIHEYKGYCDLAAADYNAAVRHDPKLALAYIHRGGLRWQQGQIEEATSDLKRAVALCDEALRANPDEPQTYRARALAWRTLEQYDRAVEDYGRMIRLSPGSMEAYVERGRTHAKRNDMPASVADFDQAIRLATAVIDGRPMDAQGYRYRTEAYDAKAFAWKDPDDFRQAVADCDFVLRLAPDCPTAYFRRGHLHGAASHFAGNQEAGAAHFRQAEADLGQAIRLDPTFAAAWHERGLLYVRAALRDEKPELALRGVADLTEMIRLVPRAALAYCGRGSAYGLAGDYQRALADFDRAVRLCPKMADAYALRGGAHLALGKQDAAQADLARAQQLRTRTR